MNFPRVGKQILKEEDPLKWEKNSSTWKKKISREGENFPNIEENLSSKKVSQ